MPTKTGAELLETGFHLLQDPAFDADLRSIVHVTRFGALQPHVFTIETFLRHGLLHNLGDDTRADCLAAFAHCEAHTDFHRDALAFKVDI